MTCVRSSPSRFSLTLACAMTLGGCSDADAPPVREDASPMDAPPSEAGADVLTPEVMSLDAADPDATTQADASTDTGAAPADALAPEPWRSLRCGLNVNAIWGSGPDDVYIASRAGLLRLRGASLTTEVPGASANGVWGRSATEVYAIIGLEVRVSRGDGVWRPHSTFPTGAFSSGGLTGSASSLYALVGDNGGHVSAHQYAAAGGWSPLRSGRRDDAAIWVAQEGEIYVGGLGRDPVSHWRDGALTGATRGGFPALFDGDRRGRSVWGSAPTDVYLLVRSDLAEEGVGLYHSDGTDVWTRLAEPALRLRSAISTGPIRVWGTGPTDVYVAEDEGRLWHFDGRAWSSEEVPEAATIRAIWGSTDGTLLLGGECLHRRRR